MVNRTRINQKTNKQLKQLFLDKGITNCERCGNDNFLSFAHKHKRRWYYDKPELLADFNQVLLLCIPCHQQIEYNKELTKKWFNELR